MKYTILILFVWAGLFTAKGQILIGTQSLTELDSTLRSGIHYSNRYFFFKYHLLDLHQDIFDEKKSNTDPEVWKKIKTSLRETLDFQNSQVESSAEFYAYLNPFNCSKAFQSAFAHFKEGKLSSAIQTLEKDKPLSRFYSSTLSLEQISKDQNFQTALFLGRLYETRLDFAKAEQIYQELLKVAPKAAEVLWAYAYCHLQQHAPIPALNLLQEGLLQLDETDWRKGWLYLTLSQVEVQIGDYDKAIQFNQAAIDFWQHLLQRNSNNSFIHKALSESYKRRASLYQELFEFEKELDPLQSSTAILRKYLLNDPDNAFFNALLASRLDQLFPLQKRPIDSTTRMEPLNIWYKLYNKYPDNAFVLHGLAQAYSENRSKHLYDPEQTEYAMSIENQAKILKTLEKKGIGSLAYYEAYSNYFYNQAGYNYKDLPLFLKKTQLTELRLKAHPFNESVIKELSYLYTSLAKFMGWRVELTKSMEYSWKHLQLAEQFLPENHTDSLMQWGYIMESNQNIGQMFYYQNNARQAIVFWQASLKFAVNLKDRAKIANIYSLLGKAHQKVLEVPQALDFYHKAVDLYKELMTERNDSRYKDDYQKLVEIIQKLEMPSDK